MAEPKVCRTCGIEKPLKSFPCDYRVAGRHKKECKACVNAKRRIRRNSDPEKYLAEQRAEYWSNPSRRRGYSVGQYQKNKGDPAFVLSHRTRCSSYYHAHRTQIREAIRLDYAEHPHKYIVYRNQRRAQLVCEQPYTQDDVDDIIRMQRGRCALCRKPLKSDIEIDHIKPLSRGGLNNRRNIQATHSSCNRRKQAKDPIEYMRSVGFLI